LNLVDWSNQPLEANGEQLAKIKEMKQKQLVTTGQVNMKQIERSSSSSSSDSDNATKKKNKLFGSKD